MAQHTLLKRVRHAYTQKQRLVAPLMGFPGLKLVNSTIKLAQQNHKEHYKVLQALVEKFNPDIIFPLMDLSAEANALGRYTVFPEQETPTVTANDFKIDQLQKLKSINISFDTRLQGYVEMIKLMGLSFSSTLFRGAYVTGPYTLASQIMGSDAAAMATVTDPDKLETLCEFTTFVIQDYVRLLVVAGAQIVCILEPSAAMLGPEQFERFSSDFVGVITQNCSSSDVALVYHTCGNTMHLIEKMKAKRRPFYESQQIYKHVVEKIDLSERAGESIDYLTFVSDGEPTLDVNLEEEIDLIRAYEILSSELKRVETLIGYEGNAFAFTGDVQNDLSSITAVHPMREEAVTDFLKRAGCDWSVVDKLLEQNLIVKREFQGRTFYARKLFFPRNRESNAAKR